MDRSDTAVRRVVVAVVAAPLLASATGCGPADTALPAAAPPAPEQVAIGQVVDGDTFTLADGRTVRVLGIDSCEVGTVAGDEARQKAVEQFGNQYNQPITLTREPGVEANAQGMMLRYVQLHGYDYGEQMVPFDHTGVFAGDPGGRPSPEYAARLQGMDTRQSYQSPPVARDCDGPYQPAPAPTTTSAPPTTTDQYDNGDGDPDRDADRPYVPVPQRDSGSGDSGGGSGGGSRGDNGGDGHPCGPGERDGDKDGFCGES